jgi:excisionase family DNA binding protein
MDEEILTIAQVAVLLKLHPRTIYKLAKKRIIPARRVGKKWRFLRSELMKFLQGTSLILFYLQTFKR